MINRTIALLMVSSFLAVIVVTGIMLSDDHSTNIRVDSSSVPAVTDNRHSKDKTLDKDTTYSSDKKSNSLQNINTQVGKVNSFNFAVNDSTDKDADISDKFILLDEQNLISDIVNNDLVDDSDETSSTTGENETEVKQDSNEINIIDGNTPTESASSDEDIDPQALEDVEKELISNIEALLNDNYDTPSQLDNSDESHLSENSIITDDSISSITDEIKTEELVSEKDSQSKDENTNNNLVEDIKEDSDTGTESNVSELEIVRLKLLIAGMDRFNDSLNALSNNVSNPALLTSGIETIQEAASEFPEEAIKLENSNDTSLVLLKEQADEALSKLVNKIAQLKQTDDNDELITSLEESKELTKQTIDALEKLKVALVN